VIINPVGLNAASQKSQQEVSWYARKGKAPGMANMKNKLAKMNVMTEAFSKMSSSMINLLKYMTGTSDT
jgi:hypothetical protein